MTTFENMDKIIFLNIFIFVELQIMTDSGLRSMLDH